MGKLKRIFGVTGLAKHRGPSVRLLPMKHITSRTTHRKSSQPRSISSANVALAIAVLAGLSGQAFGQTGPGLLLSTFPDGRNYVLDTGFTIQSTGEGDVGDRQFNLSILDASGRMKLDLDDVAPGINRAQPRAGFNLIQYRVDDDSDTITGNLTDASVGFGMGLFANDKWLVGITLGVGYASTQAFGDGNGWYGKADLAVGYTINANESFGLVINYDGNRSFMPDVPLPGFVYRRKIDQTLRLGIGFPFSEVIYTPGEHWTFSLVYSIPDDFNLEAEYRVNSGFSIFGALTGRTNAFHSDQLDSGSDRIIFRQQRAELGVKGIVNDRVSFVLAGGYAFGQQFEFGWDTRDSDELLEVSDEPFVRLAIEAKF